MILIKFEETLNEYEIYFLQSSGKKLKSRNPESAGK